MSFSDQLSELRSAHQGALDSTLESLLEILSGHPMVEKVILFGSYAAGRRDLFTDLDVVIVMESDKDFITRTAEIYRFIPSQVDLDLLVYTPEEFRRGIGQGFLKHALLHGKVIYEKKPAG